MTSKSVIILDAKKWFYRTGCSRTIYEKNAYLEALQSVGLDQETVEQIEDIFSLPQEN